MQPDFVERGLNIIREAETKLRVLLSQAAEEGDYDATARIAIYAKEVRVVFDKFSRRKEIDNSSPASDPSSGSYPKFFKNRNDELVVVGRSRSTETEYEHVAPKAILDQLISTLLEESRGGEPTPWKNLLPHLKSKHGSDFPEYYGRAFLRWLKANGLIVKHGHQGYSIGEKDRFLELVNLYWNQLPIQ